MTTSNCIIRGSTTGMALCALHVLAGASPASAATFELTGSITSCTPTCLSFTFLGPDPGDPTDASSVLTGFISLDDAAIADGTWEGGDVTGLSFTVLDPAKPLVASDPPDPIIDNPFTLDQSADGGGIVVANGQPITNPRGTFPACVPPETMSCVTTSAGTTDGTTLNGGFMDFWLTQGVLAANGAVIHIDFTAGTFTVNIFENLVFVAGGLLGEPRPVIALPPTLIFDDTEVGEVSSRTISASNAGSLPLVIDSVNPPEPPFGLDADDCSGRSLAPGESCILTVSFAPTAEGAAEGTLGVSSNDPNRPTAVTTLTGQGISASDIAIASPEIAGTVGTCANRTTQQHFNIALHGAHLAPCGAAGLEADRFDQLFLVMGGLAQSAATPAGRVRGINIVAFKCTNLTTGQAVGFLQAGLRHSWSCDSLQVSPGDALTVQVRGTAE